MNAALRQAAIGNINSAEGNPTSLLTQGNRVRKEFKQKFWLQKSEIKPTARSDLPCVKGVERIKILDIQVRTQLLQRDARGTLNLVELPKAKKVPDAGKSTELKHEGSGSKKYHPCKRLRKAEPDKIRTKNTGPLVHREILDNE